MKPGVRTGIGCTLPQKQHRCPHSACSPAGLQKLAHRPPAPGSGCHAGLRLRLALAEHVQHRGEAVGRHAGSKAVKDGLRQIRAEAATTPNQCMKASASCLLLVQAAGASVRSITLPHLRWNPAWAASFSNSETSNRLKELPTRAAMVSVMHQRSCKPTAQSIWGRWWGILCARPLTTSETGSADRSISQTCHSSLCSIAAGHCELVREHLSSTN